MLSKIVLLLVLSTVTFTAQDNSGLAMFEGFWKNTDENLPVAEHWEMVNDTLFGKGYYLKGNEKVLTENLKIFSTGNKTWYEAFPKVNKAPVLFELVKTGAGYFVFENPNHDFPQKILYRFSFVGKKKFLTAEISLMDGSNKKKFMMLKSGK